MVSKITLTFLVVWMLLLTVSQGFLARAIAEDTITIFKQEQVIMKFEEHIAATTIYLPPKVNVIPNTRPMKGIINR